MLQCRVTGVVILQLYYTVKSSYLGLLLKFAVSADTFTKLGMSCRYVKLSQQWIWGGGQTLPTPLSMYLRTPLYTVYWTLTLTVVVLSYFLSNYNVSSQVSYWNGEPLCFPKTYLVGWRYPGAYIPAPQKGQLSKYGRVLICISFLMYFQWQIWKCYWIFAFHSLR